LFFFGGFTPIVSNSRPGTVSILLIDLFGLQSMDEFREIHKGWVTEAQKEKYRERQPQWTESIAVGSEAFVRDMREKLGPWAIWREIVGANGIYELREPMNSYGADFSHKERV